MVEQKDRRRFAFVLMPFDPEFSHVYSELIGPALEDEGFEVQRADATFAQENILRTIIHNISVADLVVVELTTSNPNVFYELGVAHGLSRPVVLLTQDLDQVPFDLKSYRIINYSTRFDEAPELKEKLGQIARGLKEEKIQFGSPVKDFAPTEVIRKALESSDIEHEEDEKRSDDTAREDLGVIDFVSGIEESVGQINSIVERLTDRLESFGSNTETLGAKAEEISQSKSPNQAAQMRKVASEMAASVKELGESIQADLPDLDASWDSMEVHFSDLLSNAELSSDEDRESAEELLQLLDGFREAMAPGLEGLREVRNSFKGSTGLSRELNVAIRGAVKAVDDLIDSLSTGESSVVRMRNLLEQKISEAP